MSTENHVERGPVYWQSLDELAQSPDFLKRVEDTFPESGPELLNPLTRRRFLSVMGASMALAGVTGCGRRPVEHIMPFAKAPEEILPGRPLFYKTSFVLGGLAVGLMVETHEGRPTKIEGNTDHPASRGGTSGLAQASILDLYDPDRLASPARGGQPVSWTEAETELNDRFKAIREKGGAGLRILAGSDASPTLAALRGRMASTLPQAVWHTFEPVNQDNVRAGTRMAFGKEMSVHNLYDKANVVVSLDADFLGSDDDSTISIRRFADRRRIKTGAEDASPCRLYAVEPVYSLTGASADHRLRLSSGEIAGFAAGLAAELGKLGASAPGLEGVSGSAGDAKFLAAVAEDLVASRGAAVVVAGPRQPAAVHALVAAINVALQNAGQTVLYTPDPRALAGEGLSGESLKALVQALNSDQVENLLILGGNPAYDAPADLAFSQALAKAKHKMHFTVWANETSTHCDWVVPQAHYLESWGDARSADGTVSILQPMIAPLYYGRSAVEIVASLLGEAPKGYDLVRATWQPTVSLDFEKTWRRWLHDGVVAGSAFPAESLALDAGLSQALAGLSKMGAPSQGEMEGIFLTDFSVYDGRFANNAWLQECPDPMTKVSWDNVVMVSPATADALGVADQDVVEVTYKGRTVQGPALRVPGLADHCVGLPLGYGRTAAGQVGNGAGYNAYALQDSSAPSFDRGVSLRKTGEQWKLAIFQGHHNQEGRPLIREATVEEYKAKPKFAEEMVEHPPLKALWDDPVFKGEQQWGLSIDLNACVGCNACTIACQAENNVVVVGKEQVIRGRLMHWIRLDRYFEGSVSDPRVVYQPMGCQHCENAPCENVCPVNATTHSDDGLNDMVYNRCIGTRYCANNCPFKVRRFNFLDYRGRIDETIKMVHNPNVTVRMRGVMEKCSYCVQRIHSARRDAKIHGKTHIEDGAVQSACQQACPAGAIVFGDVRDPKTRVSQLKAQDRNYELLKELNIRPRTSYLARIRNPNPKLG